ncbi:unnamed protein product [Linum tenue]|uniref:F-box domain-containing protein n=1 Tax=Linum tenue TaxID=586396 RepID=A0AAV0P6P9_9ROSI|nr:unnamed protein product [Linum tenue]
MARTDKWKVPEPGIDDRLTSLPDEIISHILSFLPTKYAVGTAVLSRRWKDLWTRVSNLDFDNRLVYRDLISSRVANYFRLTEMEDRRRDVEFLRFVDRVFSQHRNLDSVRCFRFHVSVSRAMQDYLNKRGLAFGSQVEEIDVMLLEAIVSQLCLQLPESFYTLKNLKVAKLHEVKATVNGSVSLPSLKILELWDVLAEDRESLSRLITGCPILETLRLEHCILLDMNENDVLIASIPSLRNLTIIAFLAEDDDKCLCRIAMEAPKLEHLYLEDFTELEFLCSSSPLPCLDSARVDTGRRASSYQSLVRLLAQISSAKEMCLYWNTLVMNIFPLLHKLHYLLVV